MDEQLISLYHRHVATAFDRQLRFAEFLEKKAPGANWTYDPNTAELAFGKLKFEAPVVGSHAEHNDSWLWAWDNKNLKLTLTNRALGTVVRATLHRLGLHALAHPGFALEPLLGPDLTEHAPHVLGIILTRELEYDTYYLTPYSGGRGLVLVRDKRLKFTEKHPFVHIPTVFTQVISALPVFDHRGAFANYVRDYGLTVTEEPHAVTASAGRTSVTAIFDALGRLTHLDGTVVPGKPVVKSTGKKPRVGAPKAAKKPAATKPPAEAPPKKKPGKKP
jgi:hypothetical protein